MPGVWLNLLGIVLIDLVLSGDNAVVIGMAVRRLPRTLRVRAVLVGTLGAVGLRIVFTMLAAYLLGVPYLAAAGGLVLFWIAAKLLRGEEEEGPVGEADDFWQAVGLIILADITLSLDNVLAVAAASEGHFWLLVFGLLLSIPILMLGANLVAELLQRMPWLNLIGALVIVWAGARLIAHDPELHARLPLTSLEAFGLGVLVMLFFLRGEVRRLLGRG